MSTVGPDLTELKKYLLVLDLSPTRVPTMQEYKKAYREKLKLHPDWGGETGPFQAITEAALYVFQYITSHNDQQPRKNSEKDIMLIKTFESENNVVYHTGSVVFEIKQSEGSIWIDSLKNKLGDPVELPDGSGCIMKQDNFKIPAVSCHTKATSGTLTVTVYPNPKNGQPKIMVQGKMYLAFITFIIPLVIQDIHAATSLPAIAGLGAAAIGANSESEDNDDDSEPATKATDSDLESFSRAFKRMECEVVTLRNDLVQQMTTNLPKNSDENELSKIGKRIEILENLLKSNLDQFNTLSQSLEKLNKKLDIKITGESVTLGPQQFELLAQSISDHLKVSEITTSLTTLSREVATSAEVQKFSQQVA